MRRDTEQAIFPNRGHDLGNFYVGAYTPEASWVMVSEWPRDAGERNGNTLLASLVWTKPNTAAVLKATAGKRAGD